MEHVDDFADKLPDSWRSHGGVFVPMYQSEALWIKFTGDYPCAVKIAAGKINAVSGESWNNGLSDDPQDYVVTPDQPWLDGFNVSKEYIRRFVAMPLGEGFTAEEQITGKAEHGGLQIIVYPMKHDEYIKHFENDEIAVFECMPTPDLIREAATLDMGLAAGGFMRQIIYDDEFGIDAWDQENGFRCFIHLANSDQYQEITGYRPPYMPPTAGDYTSAGLPWFDYYGDSKALSGSDTLGKLTSVAAKSIENGNGPLPGNDPIRLKNIQVISKDGVVRDGEF